MSQNKLKTLAIKDFLFEGLDCKQKNLPDGYFPPKTQKSTFQMPRPVLKHKISLKDKIHQKNQSFLTTNLTSCLKKFMVPSLMLNSLSHTKYLKPKEKVLNTVPKRSNTIAAFQPIIKQRPKTSVVTSRKLYFDDFLCSGPSTLITERKKRDKIEVFIRIPTFETQDPEFE